MPEQTPSPTTSDGQTICRDFLETAERQLGRDNVTYKILSGRIRAAQENYDRVCDALNAVQQAIEDIAPERVSENKVVKTLIKEIRDISLSFSCAGAQCCPQIYGEGVMKGKIQDSNTGDMHKVITILKAHGSDQPILVSAPS